MADFGWALEQLKAGKKVRQHTWMSGQYIYSDALGIYYMGSDGVPGKSWHSFSSRLLATDWELCEEPKPTALKATYTSTGPVRVDAICHGCGRMPTLAVEHLYGKKEPEQKTGGPLGSFDSLLKALDLGIKCRRAIWHPKHYIAWHGDVLLKHNGQGDRWECVFTAEDTAATDWEYA